MRNDWSAAPFINRYAKHHPDYLFNFDRCGTIMDLLACALTGSSDGATMSAHNAASWGYFNTDKK